MPWLHFFSLEERLVSMLEVGLEQRHWQEQEVEWRWGGSWWRLMQAGLEWMLHLMP